MGFGAVPASLVTFPEESGFPFTHDNAASKRADSDVEESVEGIAGAADAVVRLVEVELVLVVEIADSWEHGKLVSSVLCDLPDSELSRLTSES